MDEKEKQERMRQLEEDPPSRVEDWPDDELKYETFGGGEGDHGYDEGPEVNLGPSGLRHYPGGEVEIDGEKVDNPDEYKGDPIPGGPTDPDAPLDNVEKRKDKIKERAAEKARSSD